MNRRRFLTLAPAFLAAPALVRAASIMPVKAVQHSYASLEWVPVAIRNCAYICGREDSLPIYETGISWTGEAVTFVSALPLRSQT